LCGKSCSSLVVVVVIVVIGKKVGRN